MFIANKTESENNVVWYFAYGSNLSKKQMNDRVGPWRESQKATLRSWKLVFNVPSTTWGGVAANIVLTGHPSDVVFGAIYLITQDQLDILTNKYEHDPPKTVSVDAEGKNKKAEVYVFKNDKPRIKPSDKYLQTILSGLRDHGYPDEIIKSIETSSY